MGVVLVVVVVVVVIMLNGKPLKKSSGPPALERKGTGWSAPNFPLSVYPCVKYVDADAALSFLTSTLCGQEHLVVRDSQGGVTHAEVKMGMNGIVMLKRISSETDRQSKGGQSCVYVYVKDVAAHCGIATERGAAITRPLEDRGPGGKSYTCIDNEGNEWVFGNYLP